jgi:prephenate dehydratase
MKKIGIQGGRGSFNHQALLHYTSKQKITSFEPVYLYTTKNVLSALEAGDIDQGQFAIHNTLGGLVKETINEIGKHRFEVRDTYQIQIAHCILKRKDAPLSSITTLMAHPQVFAQCNETLKTSHSSWKQVVGEGDFIDHARVAQGLVDGEIDDNIAVVGPAALASEYGLDIIVENVQDRDDNATTFLMTRAVL